MGFIINFGMLSFTSMFSLAVSEAGCVKDFLVTGFLVLVAGFFSFFAFVLVFFEELPAIDSVSTGVTLVGFGMGDFIGDGDFFFAGFSFGGVFGVAGFFAGLTVFLAGLGFFFGLDFTFVPGSFPASLLPTAVFFSPCLGFVVALEVVTFSTD